MSDSDKITSDFVVDRFRVKIEETANHTSRESLEKALNSFSQFLSGSNLTVADLDDKVVGEWASWLFSRGYSYNTVTFYLNRLSSLYGKVIRDLAIEDNGCFSLVKERLKEASEASLELYSIPDCFGKLRRLVLENNAANPLRQMAKDLVLFSLYNGGLDFDRLAAYRKGDYQGNDESALAIVERYSKPKNKYLFPLRQSERTPRQLRAAVGALFSDALKSADIKLSAYRETLPTDLWAIVAIRCGYSAADVAGCLDANGMVNPLFSFADRQELPPEQQDKIRSRVARILSKNPEDWYAMRFRPRVDYDMICTRLRIAGITLSKSFYPMEEIVRRVGKKLRRESRPVVPGLLFFKSKATSLPELFYQIGDLAWGYRYSRKARSPYAIIPQKAIDDYERAVGKFVDCMDTYPEGTFRFEEGDKVEITGGDFSGHPAIFEKEIREETKDGTTVTRVTNRLKLAGIDNFSWTVELDPRQMIKISDDRFDTLKQNLRLQVV